MCSRIDRFCSCFNFDDGFGLRAGVKRAGLHHPLSDDGRASWVSRENGGLGLCRFSCSGCWPTGSTPRMSSTTSPAAPVPLSRRPRPSSRRASKLPAGMSPSPAWCLPRRRRPATSPRSGRRAGRAAGRRCDLGAAHGAALRLVGQAGRRLGAAVRACVHTGGAGDHPGGRHRSAFPGATIKDEMKYAEAGAPDGFASACRLWHCPGGGADPDGGSVALRAATTYSISGEAPTAAAYDAGDGGDPGAARRGWPWSRRGDPAARA